MTSNMGSNTPASFALRPLPVGDRRPQNLSEFIQRVNAERGGFRTVTEEKMREEVEAAANGVVESKELDHMKDDDDDELVDKVGPEEFTKALEEVYLQARYGRLPFPLPAERLALLTHLCSSVAHQNAMLALDIISLLLTKEDPAQASTVSPMLQQLVGVGVLGADKLAKSNITESRLQDHKTVVTGWKFADIDRTVDSLLTSASRLQKEMTVEAKYWAEVLAVSEKGWTITRVPNEPQSLGVRYGFSEAAADFRSTSLAPMRRGEDGTVELDCGTILGESKRLLVTLENNGRVIGRSSLPKPLPKDAPLEDVVLEARDTIYAQELWHEMNREGRLLLSYGVRIESGTLSYCLDKDTRIVFTLHPLEENLEDVASRSLPEDRRAEALSAALHQLLMYAHRVNNQRRSHTSPRKRIQTTATQPYQLLRPMLAHMQHEQSIEDATRFISDISTILQAAGVTTAMFKLTEPPISPDSAAARGSPPEALALALLRPMECQFEVNITPDARLLIHCQTALKTFISTTFQIHFLPAIPGEKGLLQAVYPPGEISNREGYMLPDLKYYLRQAVIRVLVDRASKVVQHMGPSLLPDSKETTVAWTKDISGTRLEKANGENESLAFDVVVPEPDGPLTQAKAQQPELQVHGSWDAGQPDPMRQTWTWTVHDAVRGIKNDSLEQVVREVVSRTA